MLSEVQESVKTGLWVGDCFIYTNSANRLNYYVGGEIVTVAHLDRYGLKVHHSCNNQTDTIKPMCNFFFQSDVLVGLHSQGQ
jgi:hypothetical protein